MQYALVAVRIHVFALTEKTGNVKVAVHITVKEITAIPKVHMGMTNTCRAALFHLGAVRHIMTFT